MVVEVKNLVTNERKPILAPSPKMAVQLAAAEDRTFGHPFRALKEAFHLKREVRRGMHTVFCGNWMADLRGEE